MNVIEWCYELEYINSKLSLSLFHYDHGVVLRSGRVSDNMAVFLKYTTEVCDDTVLHQGSMRGKFCPCSGNGQTLALARHAASGVAGAQGLHGL